jgi:hypothetical protein
MGRGGFQNWQDLRDHLIDLYNDTPHPVTEQEIIDAYQLHPDHLTKVALEIAGDTNISSHWGVLAHRASRIRQPPSNPKADHSREREKRIDRAETWIYNAGIHFHEQHEVQDELFGDRGLLHAYAKDEDLVDRILALWAEKRPIGEKIEAEAHTRAEKWKEQHTETPEDDDIPF